MTSTLLVTPNLSILTNGTCLNVVGFCPVGQASMKHFLEKSSGLLAFLESGGMLSLSGHHSPDRSWPSNWLQQDGHVVGNQFPEMG